GSSRNSGELAFNVIAGLDPAIHVFPRKVYWQQWVGRPHVDARVKRGHDGVRDGNAAFAVSPLIRDDPFFLVSVRISAPGCWRLPWSW
ncbi:MAG TPA: hypothetical protein VK196_02275, partial [Magnetospirillum sp.]|nr:hypothetical protein [Magnetospirillum sp.]